MSKGRPTETWVWASAQLLSASQFRMLTRDVWQECMFEHNWNSVRGSYSSIFLSSPVLLCVHTPAGSLRVLTLILPLHKSQRIVFFPAICLLSCSCHGGRVNKAWLGVAGQLFSGSPQIPPVTSRQLLPVFFPDRRIGRGERGGVEMLSLCFLWPLPDCTYCCRAGWKGKGFTAEKSCSWISLCASLAPW